MARQTTIQLIDDIDGESEASETVSYSLDGTSYEIDLNDVHAAEFREAFTKYTSVSRKAGRAANGKSSKKTSATSSGPSAEDIRAWAKANKLKVSERGRISAEIRDAYLAAN